MGGVSRISVSDEDETGASDSFLVSEGLQDVANIIWQIYVSAKSMWV